MRKLGNGSTKIVIPHPDRFFEEMRRKEEEKKELVSNYDYMLWLEAFTLLHENFTDDSWLYNPGELSESDNANVEKLNLFFDALSQYCHKYYINIECGEDFEEERMYIRHNNVVYQLGLVVGQGAYVYVIRKEPEDGAIEFSDVVNDVEPKEFEAKDAKMKEFKQLVAEMKTMNIPTSVMLEIVNK